jgi:hypothetical protein
LLQAFIHRTAAACYRRQEPLNSTGASAAAKCSQVIFNAPLREAIDDPLRRPLDVTTK